MVQKSKTRSAFMALTVLASLSLLSACGQNYHFTKDQGKSGGESAQSTNAETANATPAPQPKLIEEKISAPAVEIADSVPLKKITPPDTLVARPLHKSGGDKIDGLDASPFNPETFTPESIGDEYYIQHREWSLPYHGFRSVAKNRRWINIPVHGINDKIEFGSGTEPKASERIRDAQVLIPFDIPAEISSAKITKINSIMLTIALYKYAEDHQKRTELLCVVAKQTCSGIFFNEPGWKNAANTDYKPLLNREFADVMEGASVPNARNKGYKIPEQYFSFDLLKLFDAPLRNSAKPPLTQADWIKLLQDKVFYLVAADDLTVIGVPTIKIDFEVES